MPQADPLETFFLGNKEKEQDELQAFFLGDTPAPTTQPVTTEPAPPTPTQGGDELEKFFKVETPPPVEEPETPPEKDFLSKIPEYRSWLHKKSMQFMTPTNVLGAAGKFVSEIPSVMGGLAGYTWSTMKDFALAGNEIVITGETKNLFEMNKDAWKSFEKARTFINDLPDAAGATLNALKTANDAAILGTNEEGKPVFASWDQIFLAAQQGYDQSMHEAKVNPGMFKGMTFNPSNTEADAVLHDIFLPFEWMNTKINKLEESMPNDGLKGAVAYVGDIVELGLMAVVFHKVGAGARGTVEYIKGNPVVKSGAVDVIKSQLAKDLKVYAAKDPVNYAKLIENIKNDAQTGTLSGETIGLIKEVRDPLVEAREAGMKERAEIAKKKGVDVSKIESPEQMEVRKAHELKVQRVNDIIEGKTPKETPDPLAQPLETQTRIAEIAERKRSETPKKESYEKTKKEYAEDATYNLKSLIKKSKPKQKKLLERYQNKAYEIVSKILKDKKAKGEKYSFPSDTKGRVRELSLSYDIIEGALNPSKSVGKRSLLNDPAIKAFQEKIRPILKREIINPEHRTIIQDAKRQGLPVPENVIKEYGELFETRTGGEPLKSSQLRTQLDAAIRRRGQYEHMRGESGKTRTQAAEAAEKRIEETRALEEKGKKTDTEVLAELGKEHYLEGDRIASERRRVNIWDEFSRAMYDVTQPLRETLFQFGDAGKAAARALDVRSGSSEKALDFYNKNVKPIFKGVDTSKLKQVIDAKLRIKRAETQGIMSQAGTPVEAFEALLKTLPEKEGRVLNRRADQYFEATRKALDLMYDQGFISPEAYQEMVRRGDYSPTHIAEYIGDDPVHMGKGGKGEKDAPMRKQTESTGEGHHDWANTDTYTLEMFDSVFSAIDNNNAVKRIFSVIAQNPEGARPYMRVALDATEKPPAGFGELSAVVEGNAERIFMRKDILKSFKENDPQMTAVAQEALSLLTGTKILKYAATTGNPTFPISNIPRDMQHIFTITDAYSKNAPKAFNQMRGDLKEIRNDKKLNQYLTDAYRKYGGGAETLTRQSGLGYGFGKASGKIGDFSKKILQPLDEIIGYLGQKSEQMTRKMLMFRELKNGKSIEQAVHSAKSYIDFSKHGYASKFGDVLWPYFGAGIQGARGLGRAFKTDPLGTSYKAIQNTMYSAMLRAGSNQMHPEAMRDLNDTVKDINFIIPTGMSYKDEDGHTRHITMKVARDQTSRGFGVIGDAIGDKLSGKEIDVGKVTKEVQHMLAFIPSGVTPMIAAVLGYSANEDFWLDEPMWRGDENIEPWAEYTEETSPFARKLGKWKYFTEEDEEGRITGGISPERLVQSFQKITTRHNPIARAFGAGLNKMAGEDQDNKATLNDAMRLPGAKRIFAITTPDIGVYDIAGKKNRLERTERKLLQDQLKHGAQKVKEGTWTIKDVMQHVKMTERMQQFPEQYDRLPEKIEKHVEMTYLGIKNPSFWNTIRFSANSNAQAFIYNAHRNTLPPERQEELDKELYMQEDIATDKFMTFFAGLQKANEKQ